MRKEKIPAELMELAAGLAARIAQGPALGESFGPDPFSFGYSLPFGKGLGGSVLPRESNVVLCRGTFGVVWVARPVWNVRASGHGALALAREKKSFETRKGPRFVRALTNLFDFSYSSVLLV